MLDLNDGLVQAGELDGLTLGVNWYLNPNTRLMFNYIRSHLERVGDTDIVSMRVQFNF